MFYFGVPGKWYVQVFVPVSHCKDTYYFDKTNNFFKKVKEKGDQVSDLLCPKLTKLLYNTVPSILVHAVPFHRIFFFKVLS